MVLVLCLFHIFTTTTLALNAITPKQSIKDGETLVSASGTFELGFFSPRNSKGRYLGIWYKKISAGTVVWVANREASVSDASGVLSFNDRGILSIMNSTGGIVWSSNTSRTAPEEPVAQLLDSGNFVVKDRNDSDPESFLWQSFDYPCDTFLPGMKIGRNFVTGFDRHLSSWKSEEDPAPGLYTIRIEPHGLPQFVLKKGPEILFRAGSWNGLYFSGRSVTKANPVYSYEFVLNKKEVSFKYETRNSSIFSRYLMNPAGLAHRSIWNERKNDWEVFSVAQADQCSIYAYCGSYATCNTIETPPCKCLEGFKRRSASSADLSSVNWSDGCTRRTPLACDEFTEGGQEIYVRLAGSDINHIQSKGKLTEKQKARIIIASVVIASVIMILALALYVWKIKSRKTGEHVKEDLELPVLEFATVVIATNNFSSNNKLGQGGFGPVYKISDFGLARKFGVDQTQANTKRVVGTYGYMSPEYVLDGLFSMKSDVFSFGVLVMEIVAGKKNRGFSHPEHDHNLLGHAWRLWMEKRPLELLDIGLHDSYDETEVLSASRSQEKFGIGKYDQTKPLKILMRMMFHWEVGEFEQTEEFESLVDNFDN
ncbi:hypothetical protein V6N11_038659 [Hibiscus sabdariffa]|uniref:Uncharacterized protein n=1 Tax=Hibiscus sabdariffa TaxID=183260 RepID=A0ABR2SLL0_9ROSI